MLWGLSARWTTRLRWAYRMAAATWRRRASRPSAGSPGPPLARDWAKRAAGGAGERPVGGERGSARRKVRVEAEGVGVEVAEEEGRAVLVLLVVEHGEDAGVVQRLDDLELTGRRPPQPLPVLLRGRLGDGVL